MRWLKALFMKIIPFSPITEFQRESQRAVRGDGYAESAVWAVFAASSAISILLSLSQITPEAAQSGASKDGSVVCEQQNEQQNLQPTYPLQTT
jgi:hypothetical protein